MFSNKLVLHDAANVTNKSSDLPTPSLVVKSLLEAEKVKKGEENYSLSNLIGEWNLRFVTGTKKTRKKAGIVLGAGKYIPQLVKIKIKYEGDQETLNTVRVLNSVSLAFFSLSLTGPIKFIKNNILVFDFIAMTFSIFGWKVYDGYIRNGATKEAQFYHKKIPQQVFFHYFLIEKNIIAARGKGGGLALWSRENNVQ